MAEVVVARFIESTVTKAQRKLTGRMPAAGGSLPAVDWQAGAYGGNATPTRIPRSNETFVAGNVAQKTVDGAAGITILVQSEITDGLGSRATR